MIVLALIPPLWRRVMDKRVVAHFDGDVRLANVGPGRLEKLLATFPPPADPAPEETAEIADVTRQTFDEEVAAGRCPGCGYVYDVAVGNELEGFAAGTAWRDIPDDWCCPDCGVREKVDFIPLKESTL
jgi:alkane 1-monooxygenase